MLSTPEAARVEMDENLDLDDVDGMNNSVKHFVSINQNDSLSGLASSNSTEPPNLGESCDTQGQACANNLICSGDFVPTCQYKFGETCTRKTAGTYCAGAVYGRTMTCDEDTLKCCIDGAPTLCSANCAPLHAVHSEEAVSFCCSGAVLSTGEESIEMTEMKTASQKKAKPIYGFCK